MTKLKELENVHYEYEHTWCAEHDNITVVTVLGEFNKHEKGLSVNLMGHVEPHHPIFQKAVEALLEEPVDWDAEGIEEVAE